MVAPSEYRYGKVVGRIIQTVADGEDADRYPDVKAASGNVLFKPKKKYRTTSNYSALVINQTVKTTLYAPDDIYVPMYDIGTILDEQGNEGVWLVTGTYVVEFQLNEGTYPPVEITVSESNDDNNPLDLIDYLPKTPPVGVAMYTLEVPSGGRTDDTIVRGGSGELKWDSVDNILKRKDKGLDSRIAHLETMSGVSPGSATDAQTASLIQNTETATRTSLGLALSQELLDALGEVRSSLGIATRQILEEETPPKIVTSTTPTNLVITGDPSYMAEENEIVFLYETWRHFEKLNTLDTTTPEWEPEQDRWEISNGRLIHKNGPTYRAVRSLNSFNSQSEKYNVEVVAKVRYKERFPGDGTSLQSPGVAIRGHGTTTEDSSAITLLLAPGVGARLSWYMEGVHRSPGWGRINFDLESEAWYWMRLRGFQNQLSAKVWADTENEPEEWNVQNEVSSESLITPGWVGLVAAASYNSEFESIGVATHGDTAPRENVS